jgi:hypothetical protein
MRDVLKQDAFLLSRTRSAGDACDDPNVPDPQPTTDLRIERKQTFVNQLQQCFAGIKED